MELQEKYLPVTTKMVDSILIPKRQTVCVTNNDRDRFPNFVGLLILPPSPNTPHTHTHTQSSVKKQHMAPEIVRSLVSFYPTPTDFVRTSELIAWLRS
jgi:hypothetical protein